MKILGLFIILMCGISFGSVALAAPGAVSSCDRVILSKYLPEKAYDQKDIGWCYAYSASDLVSYKYRDILKGRYVSPLHIALLQNAYAGEKFDQQKGTVKEAAKLATHRYIPDDTSGFFRGLCLSTVDEKILSYQPNRSIRAQFYQLSELKSKFDESSRSGNKVPFLNQYALMGKDNSPVTYVEPVRLNQMLQNSSLRTIGLGFIDMFCPLEGRFVAPKSEYPTSFNIGDEISISQKVGPTVYTSITSSAQVMAAVHEQLGKHNIVSIRYYAAFLEPGQPNHTIGDYHASTVVGREEVNGVCHIVIRNSWGDCLDSKGKSRYSQNVTQCKDGTIWVPEKTLLKNLEGITYIKP